jgi:thiamine-phosphate pyrophosphorylase
MSTPPRASDGLDAFYPIVPDAGWVQRIVPLGVKVVQLRLKDASRTEILRQIALSLAACHATGCQLIVNDHWLEAIAAGADYVHLGQEDLDAADLRRIRAAGIRLGISTHDRDELEIALAAKPQYVALGPIWETKLKPMACPPQGLERIREWKQAIGSLPLVAIGGITPERAPQVIAAGARSAAVITDFFTHPEPDKRIAQWVTWAQSV